VKSDLDMSSTILLRKIKIVFFTSLFCISGLYAQDCATVEHNQELLKKGVIRESDNQFEDWIRHQLELYRHQQTVLRKKSTHHLLRVVVHIIHNDEAIGMGANISDAQVESQIKVLNNDFKRLNADAGDTPAEFLPVASGMNIEFVLAGINRVKGTKATWTRDDDVQLKSLSYWPAEHYINIWVCNLIGFRGYAQFPLSTLPGVEVKPTLRLTDGIVVGYSYFGSINDGDFDLNTNHNRGRTATHEMGHFLGLRHNWGDEDDCSGTDYVDDTPPQKGSTTGCPSHPQKSCPDENPVNKMFQNYMDFTYDRCMNLFTLGQVERMQVILESSPRRASLVLPLDPEDPGYPPYAFEKIFSPNGDGINDYWRWTNTLEYEGCKLTIFNRFGKPVYEKVSYDNSWDGRSSDGFILEAGAYYFTIRCDGKKDIKGGVQIVR
jgi:gliding motility-associated-like protein